MTEELHSMLREAADDRPDLALPGDPWRRGRHIRLRRRLAGIAGATATAAAVVAGTVLLTTPDLSTAPEPAQEESVEPALPDTLYEVPPNIPDISDEPLGEAAAAVYFGTVRTGLFSDPETRPLVVGAEYGGVRAVREAGPHSHAVLSPDGRLLAVADMWHPEVSDDPASVLIVDVVTGESTRHDLPGDGLGGGVETLTWMPDEPSVAVTFITTTKVDDDGSQGTGRPLHGILDARTGAWREDSALRALSPDGQRTAIAGGDPSGFVIQGMDGSDPVFAGIDGSYYGIAFSPDSQRVAVVQGGVTPPDSYQLKIIDATTGEPASELDLGVQQRVHLLGWGHKGVLVQTTREVGGADKDDAVLETLVERIEVDDLDEPTRTTVIVDEANSWSMAIPAAFLDAEVREAPAPDAPLDWAAWVPDPLLLAVFGLVGVGVALEHLLRRRRRKIEIVPVTGELEVPPERPGR